MFEFGVFLNGFVQAGFGGVCKFSIYQVVMAFMVNRRLSVRVRPLAFPFLAEKTRFWSSVDGFGVVFPFDCF